MRFRLPVLLRPFGACSLALALCIPAVAQVNVVTRGYDTHRTGANLAEMILNPSNTTYGSFGKLAFKSLDGTGYTQPLLVSNINVAGKVRNVLYVVTNAMDVYAFDADDFNTVGPLWHVALTTATKADVYGVLSTPVIDPVSGTLYAVTRTQEGPSSSDSSYKFRLWAVNIYSGSALSGSGQQVTAMVTGTGDNTDGAGHVVFNGKRQQQRPALLLSNGFLYICFGSNGDTRPYHGWIFCYNAQTLAQSSVYCINPNSGPGGIWGSGSGPSVDDNGSIYFTTGNGSGADGTGLFGDSILKFSGDGTLTLQDRYTPYNVSYLNRYNLDLGVTGPICIPGTTYVVTGCKQGKLYLVDGSNMGGVAGSDSAAIAAFDDEIHGSPVFYNGQNGPMIYCWGQNDYLKAFSISNGHLSSTPIAQSSFMATQGDPGGFLALSANSADPTSAVLWSSMPFVGDASGGNLTPSVLRAFDPNSLKELWNSYTNLVDDTWFFAKNVPPLVANGKVYIVNGNSFATNRLNIYGLLNSGLPQPPQSLKAIVRPGANRLFWIQNPNTTGYTIYRSTTANGSYSAIASITTNSYIDTNIKAKANYYYYVVASNLSGSSLPSATTSAIYTSGASSTSISYPSFTASSGLKLNGKANVAGSTLNLTDGSPTACGSAYYTATPVPDEFNTTFTFKFNGPSVNGLTYVVQYCQDGSVSRSGSLGANQNELGYGPDPSTGRGVEESVGVKFVNGGANNSSTGILFMGRDPSFETDSLANSGIDFSTGDVFKANLTYDGITLTCTLTDLTTSATVTHSYVVNIYSLMFSSNAYVGFTGSADSGSMPSVLSWTFGQ